MDIMTFIFLFSRITKYLLRLTLIIVSPSSSLPFGNANRKALVPMQICSLWYYAQIVVSKKIYTPYLFETYSKRLIQNISNYVLLSDGYRIIERRMKKILWYWYEYKLDEYMIWPHFIRTFLLIYCIFWHSADPTFSNSFQSFHIISFYLGRFQVSSSSKQFLN